MLYLEVPEGSGKLPPWRAFCFDCRDSWRQLYVHHKRAPASSGPLLILLRLRLVRARHTEVPQLPGVITFYDPRNPDTWYSAGTPGAQHTTPARTDTLEPSLRGTLPFAHAHVVRPRAGDLLVFAPYMHHGVARGSNRAPRISFSANLPGARATRRYHAVPYAPRRAAKENDLERSPTPTRRRLWPAGSTRYARLDYRRGREHEITSLVSTCTGGPRRGAAWHWREGRTAYVRWF